MSDTETPTPEAPAAQPEAEQSRETDWKAEARKWEDRAKENLAKAKTNETAAQRLAEIEEANKTAEQKAAERLAEAERRAAELEARANRATVANEHGVPEAILAGPASASPEDLAAYAAALIAFRGDQKQTPRSDALSRVNSTQLEGDERGFVKNLFAAD